jgi:hypothetical protein
MMPTTAPLARIRAFRIQILELFMALRGIPYYLDLIRKGRSAASRSLSRRVTREGDEERIEFVYLAADRR